MSTNANKTPCCQRVYFGDWGHSKQCARNGSIERDGKHYCKQHDPVAAQMRKDEVQAAYDAEAIKKRAERERAHACVTACAGITDPAVALTAAREALEAEEKWRNERDDCGLLRAIAADKRKQALNLLTPAP